MPVIGTPVATSTPVTPINTTVPRITELYGLPLFGKMRAAAVLQAQYSKLRIQLMDLVDSIPVDMTGYGYANGIGPQGPPVTTGISWLKFRFTEASGVCGYVADAVSQDIEDATQGIISCTIPDNIAANSGVYLCEAGLFDSSNRFIFSNTIYLLVERGLFTSSSTLDPSTSGIIGAPTTQEVRVNLRDNPNLNRLIDEYEFDLADICDAMVRSVMYFNTTQPPIPQQYSTNTFPWRYQWLDGIAAHLFECAANFYRRNTLKHQTGGLTVDDLNREREYLQAWQTRSEKWMKWVQMKKVEINLAEGFATFGSPYPGAGYRSNSWW